MRFQSLCILVVRGLLNVEIGTVGCFINPILIIWKKLSGDHWTMTVAVPKPAAVKAGHSKSEATVNFKRT